MIAAVAAALAVAALARGRDLPPGTALPGAMQPPPTASTDVWPVPRVEEGSGPPLLLAPGFAIRCTGSSAVARLAVARYTAMLAAKLGQARPNPHRPASSAGGAPPALTVLAVHTGSDDDTLSNWTVDESHTLEVQPATVFRNGTDRHVATAKAATPFGALRALETFYQLAASRTATGVAGGRAAPSVDTSPGSGATPALALPHTTLRIADAPSHGHRGMLIDLGRRLCPLPFVRSIVDAMSFAKLNVLHLHLNDMGRFAFESKVHPELNVGCLGDGTCWTQAQVKALVVHARLRGVRLVPELEMSQHSKALLPLARTRGLAFCNTSFPTMLYDDPAGVTFGVIKNLLTEMAGLFVDEVVHYSDPRVHDPLDVGMCGLQNPPRCDARTVRSLQHRVLSWAAGTAPDSLQGRLREKQTNPRPVRPMAWHNVCTDCGDYAGCALPNPVPPSSAGVPSTVVEVYAGARTGTGAATMSAAQLLANVTAAGHAAVMADAGRLYLDTGSTTPADYYKATWFDIGAPLRNTSGPQRALLLGGSLSLWSDRYCSGTVECGGWAYCPNGAPSDTCVSAQGWMQDAKYDAEFIESAGGLLFPRANVGAGSFWNYRADLAPDSAEVLRRTDALAASMAGRGVMGLCPPGCSCSFGSRCGKPYQKPPST